MLPTILKRKIQAPTYSKPIVLEASCTQRSACWVLAISCFHMYTLTQASLVELNIQGLNFLLSKMRVQTPAQNSSRGSSLSDRKALCKPKSKTPSTSYLPCPPSNLVCLPLLHVSLFLHFAFLCSAHSVYLLFHFISPFLLGGQNGSHRLPIKVWPGMQPPLGVPGAQPSPEGLETWSGIKSVGSD